MTFTETKLKGAYIIDIKRMEDGRGFFARSFCKQEFENYSLNADIVQCNISYNKFKATLRGLHMQAKPYSEAKIIRCSRGKIYDVIVDMRKKSETFKQWIGVELSADNCRMLYVPENFIHGFITLEDETEVAYQMTQFYKAGSELGFRWNDPAFKIQWPIEPTIISERDKAHPLLQSETIDIL